MMLDEYQQQQQQKQQFNIRESLLLDDDEGDSNTTFKLGKSLFILLNDSLINNNNKIKLVNNNSNSNEAQLYDTNNSILSNNQTDFKKAFDSLDKSININPNDSILSIIDSIVLKFNEIQLKHSWKLDISTVISNLSSSPSSTTVIETIDTIQQPQAHSQPIPNPPQHYFKVYRLFSYILLNHSSLFYKCLLLKLSPQHEQEQEQEQYSKEEKKQILDIFNIAFQFLLIFNLNNYNKSTTPIIDTDTKLLIIKELIPTIIDKIINKCSIIVNETISPTRLTTQSSDLILSLFITLIINNNNQDDHNNINNQLKIQLIDYFKEIKKWYISSKPLLSFSIDIIMNDLIPNLQFNNNNSVLKQVILLFIYQIPLVTKNKIINDNINNIITVQQQKKQNQAIIEISIVSIITTISNLSDKSQITFIKDNQNALSNILQYLMTFGSNFNSLIIKKCTNKLIEIIYNIKLDSSGDYNNNYLTSLITNVDNLSEQPILIDFIINSISKSPILIQQLIVQLDINNSKITDNIITILENTFKNSNSLITNQEEELLLDKFLPASSVHSAPTFQIFLFIVNNLDITLVFSRYLNYLFSENTEISTKSINNLINWICSSSSCSSSISPFEIFIDLILGSFSTPSSSSSSTNYNYEELINKCIPLIGENINNKEDNKYNKWKEILNVLEIKLYANPKNNILSKVLPKLIKYVDKIIIFKTLITNVNYKLQLQNQLLKNLSNSTSSEIPSLSYLEGEEVFKFLSPLLILKISIKQFKSSKELYKIIQQSNENDIIVAQLSDNLIKRLNSRNLMLEIRRLASDCCSNLPPSYWEIPMSNSLQSQYSIYSSSNDDDSKKSSSLEFIKLIIFCFCNGYQYHGSSDEYGISFEKCTKKLFKVFDSVLFSFNDSSQEIVNAGPDSEIAKLFMAVGDCISFIIKSTLPNRDEETIISNKSKTITMEKLRLKPTMILFEKLDSLDDLLPTIFRVILTKTTSTSTNTNSTYNYSIKSKTILLNSLTTVIKLLSQDTDEGGVSNSGNSTALRIYSNLIIGLLIKIYFIDNSSIVDVRVKCGTLFTLFNLIIKLDDEDGSGKGDLSLRSNADDLYDICSNSLQSSNSNIKLLGLKLLGSLMKTPSIIFSSETNLKEIQYLLALLPTDSNEQNKEITNLSKNLLNLLKK